MKARLKRTRLRDISGAVGLVIAVAIGVTAVPGVARAACARSPSLSPYGFTGTVVRLGTDHRQAFVQKDDGSQVEVDGGSLGPAISGEDFTFVLGGRYQIEPENSKSPFLVNDCTATTLLAITSVAPSEPASSPAPASAPVSAPAAAPASAQLTVFPTSSAQPDYLSIAVFVVIFALLLGFAYAVRVLRGRLHRA